MKKIGIITIQKCDNFGADLQSYALGAKLRKLGYDAENIDYLFYKHPRHLVGKNERPVLPISLVNRIKERFFPLIERMRKRRAGAAAAYRQQKFESWFKTYVPCGREYRSIADLYADPPPYEAYVVGSDQVWNPRMGSNILPYFLDFAQSGARCVSYASSLGVAELPGGVFYKYKQWLRRFAAISLREEVGVDIVKAMALGAEVKHVVDPTLLLDAEEWSAVSCEVSAPSRYLLLYDLIASEETVALAKHANILDEKSKTALLLYSCSPRLEDGVDKKLIGWGNRFLHYKDLEYLKSHGYAIYDWSGVCTDESSPKYSIGQFKLAFGGRLIESLSLSTPLYQLANIIHPLIAKIRSQHS